jgi:hypothetical protein
MWLMVGVAVSFLGGLIAFRKPPGDSAWKRNIKAELISY